MSAGERTTRLDQVQKVDSAAVWVLAGLSACAVSIANLQGISIGDDGVGYRALADSLLNGNGYGYFLERPVTVWPPIWPGLMAAVAKVLPISTIGAAILLNALVAAAVVLAGNRLLRRLVNNPRYVLLGTAVFALGPSTVGIGHVLMTDMAFALLMLVWMGVLCDFHERQSTRTLVLAASLVWVGFGLRYIGLVLIAFGGLWLLLDSRTSLTTRLRNGVLYGATASLAPAAWMLRNRAIDGTFTGERHSSALGFVDNATDLATTVGKFLLPGIGDGFTKSWAAAGVVITVGATWLIWRLLKAAAPEGDRTARSTTRKALVLLGTPLGLVSMFAVLYLVYMLYVRTTTALNILDIRLLYPAYFPLIISALAVADRISVLDAGSTDAGLGRTASEGTGRVNDRDDESQSRTGSTGSPAGRLTWQRAAWITVHGWALVNVGVGLVAMVTFGLGRSYFKGDYASDTFEAVRSNPALGEIPRGCEVYSNLPNALYPKVDSNWSPARTALESSDKTDDLPYIIRESARTDVCLVWIDEEPLYWHLFTLDDLQSKLTLTPIANDRDVEVFKVAPPS